MRNIQDYRVLYPVRDHLEAVLMTNTVKCVGPLLLVTVDNQLFIS